jgi:tRNA A-37 threonylcarbamoyl transferase component Bud32
MSDLRDARRFQAAGLRCLVDVEFEAGARALGLDRPQTFDRALREAPRCPGGRGDNHLLTTELWPERVRLRPLWHGGALARWTADRYWSSRRSEREFEIWRTLEARGAPIPRVVLAASRRRGPFWSSSLAAVNRDDAIDLDRWLDSPDRSRKSIRSVAARVARSVRRFHDAGGLHGDLHLGNLLIEESRGEQRVWLIDLGRASLRKDPTPHERMRELMRLWRSVAKTDRTALVDARARAVFLDAYSDGDRRLRRALLAHARREDKRIARHRVAWRLSARLVVSLATLALMACSDPSAGTHSTAGSSARLSLLATGDTGRSRAWAPLFEGQLAVAHAMIEEDRSNPVDALILLGDNFYSHGLERERLVERVRQNLVIPYCPLLDLNGERSMEVESSCGTAERDRHPIPFYAVLGNHDLESPESVALQREVVPDFLSNWRMSPSISESFELGNGVSLILFESELSIDDRETMQASLVGSIRAARGPWRILATHRPIATDDLGRLPVGGYPQWVRDAIEEAALSVQLVLAGHHHSLQAFALETPTQLLQIGAGSGSRASPPLAAEDVGALFSSLELGFARIDLDGEPEHERLTVTLFGTVSWPLWSRFTQHRPRARFEVDRSGRVRELPLDGRLAN